MWEEEEAGSLMLPTCLVSLVLPTLALVVEVGHRVTHSTLSSHEVSFNDRFSPPLRICSINMAFLVFYSIECTPRYKHSEYDTCTKHTQGSFNSQNGKMCGEAQLHRRDHLRSLFWHGWWACSPCSVCVVRGQLLRASPLLPLCGPQGSNSDHQAW